MNKRKDGQKRGKKELMKKKEDLKVESRNTPNLGTMTLQNGDLCTCGAVELSSMYCLGRKREG